MTNTRLMGLILASSLVLSACATVPAGVTARDAGLPREATSQVVVAAPTVSVISQAIAPSGPVGAHAASTLVSLGTAALTHDEMAEDSALSNFRLQAFGSQSSVNQPKNFARSGFVRKTATGFGLEASRGMFKSRPDTYNLAGETNVMDDIEAFLDKKVVVKGTLLNRTVTVETVRGIASMGFLFSWFTKGRIAGRVIDGTTLEPVADVTVAVSSSDGFKFSATSDDQGEFTLSGLTPGKYTVKMTAAGYQDSNVLTVDVDAREKVTLEGRLTPATAATPTPAPAN